MNNTKILSLSREIKELLSLIVQGDVSCNSAKISRENLLLQYNLLKKEMTSQDEENTLEGLCYHHNVENFSIFTAIYQSNNDNLNCIAYYGDSEVFNKVDHILNERKISFNDGQYLTILPENEPLLKNSLHINPFRYDENSSLATVALSSSPYFLESRFAHFGSFLDTIFPKKREMPGGVIDTFNSIRKFIETNIDHYDIDVQFYLFSDLNEIFSHAGSQTLFDVSAQIERQIAEHFGDHLPRYTISLREYAVIFAHEKGARNESIVHKDDFFYKGIPLPHISKKIHIEGTKPFNMFTDALFSLSH
jgi:hypothetical protein